MRGFSPPDLAVIIPSTGRAEQCARLVERIHETVDRPVNVVVSVEPDDVKPYARALSSQIPSPGQPWGFAGVIWDQTGLTEFVTGSHVAAMNRAARNIALSDIDEVETSVRMIVKMDDDHWPLTQGWDLHYLDALAELGGTGVVYGNDLHQGERLPTVPGISTNIVRELGWYAPPQLGHLFCDNFWLELGRRAGRLRYLPDTVIEHRHPQSGKAERDRTYAQGGESPQRWHDDEREWNKIIADHPAEGGTGWSSQMGQWAGAVRRLAERGTIR